MNFFMQPIDYLTGYKMPQVTARAVTDPVGLTVPMQFQTFPAYPIQGAGFLVTHQNCQAYSGTSNVLEASVINDLFGGGMLASSTRTPPLFNQNPKTRL